MAHAHTHANEHATSVPGEYHEAITATATTSSRSGPAIASSCTTSAARP